jgi:ribonuclease HI
MIEVYTDGSCKGNGEKDAYGGIGIVFVQDGKEISIFHRTYKSTTNNRMEYRALLMAMEICVHNNIENPVFVCDSQLLLNTVTKWMYDWKRSGWKKSGSGSATKIKNLDLVLHLYMVKAKLPKATYRWVKGHDGNEFNERADELTGLIDKAAAFSDAVDEGVLQQHGATDRIAY